MLSLTHASAGALAGEFIPNPILAFVAGVVIHLAMDKIPHFWPAENKDQGKVIISDTILSVAFLSGLLLLPDTRTPSVIAGALGGVSVDFFFVIVMRTKGKMAEWHTNRQPHKKEITWLATDIILFTLLTLLVWIYR